MINYNYECLSALKDIGYEHTTPYYGRGSIHLWHMRTPQGYDQWISPCTRKAPLTKDRYWIGVNTGLFHCSDNYSFALLYSLCEPCLYVVPATILMHLWEHWGKPKRARHKNQFDFNFHFEDGTIETPRDCYNHPWNDISDRKHWIPGMT